MVTTYLDLGGGIKLDRWDGFDSRDDDIPRGRFTVSRTKLDRK